MRAPEVAIATETDRRLFVGARGRRLHGAGYQSDADVALPRLSLDPAFGDSTAVTPSD